MLFWACQYFFFLFFFKKKKRKLFLTEKLSQGTAKKTSKTRKTRGRKKKRSVLTKLTSIRHHDKPCKDRGQSQKNKTKLISIRHNGKRLNNTERTRKRSTWLYLIFWLVFSELFLYFYFYLFFNLQLKNRQEHLTTVSTPRRSSLIRAARCGNRGQLLLGCLPLASFFSCPAILFRFTVCRGAWCW